MESWNEQLKTKILESEFSIKEISDKTKIPTKFIEAIDGCLENWKPRQRFDIYKV